MNENKLINQRVSIIAFMLVLMLVFILLSTLFSTLVSTLVFTLAITVSFIVSFPLRSIRMLSFLGNCIPISIDVLLLLVVDVRI